MNKRELKAETVWMIYGKYGLYSGAQFTRKDAIRDHEDTLGRPWDECVKDGDRVVKVLALFDGGIK